MQENIRRGDIVIINFDSISRGHMQHGTRPAVIVQNDMGNKHSPTIVVVPVTSSVKKMNMPTHAFVNSRNLSRESIALCEQIMTIDKDRIERRIDHLTPRQMCTIDRALQASILQQ